MHIFNNRNYKYLSLWYINFLQDVAQFSKEHFWPHRNLFSFLPSLSTCVYLPNLAIVSFKNLIKLPFFSEASTQFSQADCVAGCSVFSCQLRWLAHPSIITLPGYLPHIYTFRLWTPPRHVLQDLCLYHNTVGSCCKLFNTWRFSTILYTHTHTQACISFILQQYCKSNEDRSCFYLPCISHQIKPGHYHQSLLNVYCMNG